jgi:hypothetical protein
MKSNVKLDLTNKKTVKTLKKSFKKIKKLKEQIENNKVVRSKVKYKDENIFCFDIKSDVGRFKKLSDIETRDIAYLRCHCCDFDRKLNVDIDSNENNEWIKLSSFTVKESNVLKLSYKDYNGDICKTVKTPTEITIDLYLCPVCGNIEAFSRYCLELMPQLTKEELTEKFKNDTF